MRKPTNSLSWLNGRMPTLQDRLAEIMRAMNWQHADLVRVSGQSSSVVSQWRGKSSKLIKSIGSLDAAQRIEAASGYCALWVAKGQGPKIVARDNRATYGSAQLPDQWGTRMAALTPEQLTALQSAVEAMLDAYESARAAKPAKLSAAG